MKNKKRIENRIQKRRGQKNIQRRMDQKKAIYKESRQKGNRENLIYRIMVTMHHFFPRLFERIGEIPDYRDKSEYELSELITAGIANETF